MFVGNKTKVFIIIYVIVLLILAVVIHGVTKLSVVFNELAVLKYETLEIGDTEDCYFARQEVLHTAPTTGLINYYVGDGKKVRKGSTILSIAASKIDAENSRYEEEMKGIKGEDVLSNSLSTSMNGTISYYMDGYEEYFRPENLKALKYEDVSKLNIKTTNLTRKNCLLGEPLFKTVKDSEWYVVTWVEQKSIGNYEAGRTVNIKIGGSEIDAKIDSITEDGDKWQVVFKTNRYFESFANMRRSHAQIVTQSYSGIKIKNSGIVNQDGKAGVYIRSKNGDIIFKPINIIMTDGEYSVISNSSYIDKEGKEVLTVQVYDEMLQKPNKEKIKKNESEGK